MGSQKGLTARAKYWTPAEVLRHATSESTRVIRMARKLNKHGSLGEILKGWIADLLLINGEPLKDISIPKYPDIAHAVIIKDGKIIKSRL